MSSILSLHLCTYIPAKAFAFFNIARRNGLDLRGVPCPDLRNRGRRRPTATTAPDNVRRQSRGRSHRKSRRRRLRYEPPPFQEIRPAYQALLARLPLAAHSRGV